MPLLFGAGSFAMKKRTLSYIFAMLTLGAALLAAPSARAADAPGGESGGEEIPGVIIGAEAPDSGAEEVFMPDPIKGEFYVRVKVSGRDWLDRDSFSVVLSGVSAEDPDGNPIDLPMPEKTALVQTENTKISFGEITYREPGTYVYEVRQEAGSLSHIKYDTKPYRATVRVEKTKNGNYLRAGVTYDKGVHALIITNKYILPDPALVAIKVKKNLVGRDWKEGEKYSFRIRGEDGAPLPVNTSGAEVTKVRVSESKVRSFGQVRITEPGTYTYTISEVIPKNAADNRDGTYTKDGVTYDGTDHTVEITVTDNGEGAYVPVVLYDGQEDRCLSVTNTYDAAGTRKIYVSAGIRGRTWEEGDAFTFELTPASGTNGKGDKVTVPMPAESEITVTDPLPSPFGEIVFSEPGVYSYRITEKGGNLAGMTYDTVPRTVMIAVSENEKSGTLKTAVSYEDGGTSQRVTNVYVPEAEKTTGEIFVRTEISGRSFRNSDSFVYRIEAGDSRDADGEKISTPMPKRDTVTPAGGERAGFGKITFDAPGTYRYRVAQAIPADAEENGDGTYTKGRMTYDASAHTVKVDVTGEDGKLKADFIYDSGEDELVVENVYTPGGITEPFEMLMDLSPLMMFAVLAACVALIAVIIVLIITRKKNR